MAQTVYLLYEADAWLSYDSMVLLGVFDSDENLLGAVGNLVRDELKEDINHFRQFDESEAPTKEELAAMSDEEREALYDELQEQVQDEFLNNNLQTQAYQINYYATEATMNHLDTDGIR